MSTASNLGIVSATNKAASIIPVLRKHLFQLKPAIVQFKFKAYYWPKQEFLECPKRWGVLDSVNFGCFVSSWCERFIVMLWENQSRRTWTGTIFSKSSTRKKILQSKYYFDYNIWQFIIKCYLFHSESIKIQNWHKGASFASSCTE